MRTRKETGNQKKKIQTRVESVDAPKLEVLVTASDRLKACGFKGLMPIRKSAFGAEPTEEELD